MKKPKTLRIPRKLKKQYKKLWEQINGEKLYIIKKTIAFDSWPSCTDRKVWGCMTRPR